MKRAIDGLGKPKIASILYRVKKRGVKLPWLLHLSGAERSRRGVAGGKRKQAAGGSERKSLIWGEGMRIWDLGSNSPHTGKRSKDQIRKKGGGFDGGRFRAGSGSYKESVSQGEEVVLCERANEATRKRRMW